MLVGEERVKTSEIDGVDVGGLTVIDAFVGYQHSVGVKGTRPAVEQ